MSDIVARVLAFVLGAAWGSFLNVCISRWPAGLSVVSPRSRCPECSRPIKWYENIPVLSWVALGARCRGCRSPISMLYPMVELGVAFAWLAAVMHYGPTLTALRVAVFITLMIGIAVTDARHYLIPDGFTIFGLVWTLLFSVAAFVAREGGPFAEPYDALVGACAGAGVIAISGWLGEAALKREAMGFGDVTLMAVIGATLGPSRALVTVFLAALLGTAIYLLIIYPARVLRQRSNPPQRGAEPAGFPPIPFGVFLAPAAVVALIWGDAIITWYINRFILV